MPTQRQAPSDSHEQIEIHPARLNARMRVRQDRYSVDDARCRLVIGESELPVRNYSAFGLVAFAPRPLDVTEVRDAALMFGEVVVARLELRKVRQTQKDEGCLFAFEITGEPLNIHRMNAVRKAKAAVSQHVALLAAGSEIPAHFRRKVFEIKDVLQGLETLVNELRASGPVGNLEDAQDFENSISEVIGQYLSRLFEQTYEQLNGLLEPLESKEVKACYEFFRQQLKHLIYQSPFSARSYDKPLGYAGDYEMMNYLYRNENVGGSLFAKCLHHWYVNHPNSRAVRNRADYLFGQITRRLAQHRATDPCGFYSVACGPAIEVSRVLRSGVDAQRIESRSWIKSSWRCATPSTRSRRSASSSIFSRRSITYTRRSGTYARRSRGATTSSTLRGSSTTSRIRLRVRRQPRLWRAQRGRRAHHR